MIQRERGKRIMNNEEGIVRLAKPIKRSLLRLVFSRFLIIVLLLVLQVGILATLYGWLKEYIPHFTVAIGVFTIVMVIYLFNSPMDPAGKLTWMFLISVVPISGAFLLLFTQANAGQRLVRKRAALMVEETRHALAQPPVVLPRLEKDGSGTDDLNRYLNRSGCFPVYKGTEVTYFPIGEDKFQAMLTELAKAEKYIFMEYFIIEEGYMWGSILNILIEKAKAGVDVRVMYDGMCEISNLPSNYCSLLEKQGIKARSFAPLQPFLSSHYNYRDHRKICVIDGKTAFNGGVNLADEYINEVERFGHWKDTAVMLKGDAVSSFTLMFLQMWNLTEKQPDFSEAEEPYPKADESIRPSGYVIPYCDCPLDEDKVGEAVYMDILYRAGRYVHIMTPYLILDGELETALKYAGQRGIDVKLILPGIPDKKIAYALAKSHYRQLLRAGVKIYEYTPGFVHAKVCTSDDERAVVGTINLDYRSLYHHFECATYMYRTECIPDIEKDFQATLGRCRQVTEESLKDEALFYKVVGPLVKIIAPLM